MPLCWRYEIKTNYKQCRISPLIRSQPLLVPQSVAVSQREVDCATEYVEVFHKLGMDVAVGGEELLLIREIPVNLRDSDIEQLLRDVLSEDLKEELDSIFVPLEGDTPTEPEIRVAQAQLIGWLEGLFQGIQASLWSQQMSAQEQLEQVRRRHALEAPTNEDHTGLYL